MEYEDFQIEWDKLEEWEQDLIIAAITRESEEELH
jgi:hypothetical protein